MDTTTPSPIQRTCWLLLLKMTLGNWFYNKRSGAIYFFFSPKGRFSSFRAWTVVKGFKGEHTQQDIFGKKGQDAGPDPWERELWVSYGLSVRAWWCSRMRPGRRLYTYIPEAWLDHSWGGMLPECTPLFAALVGTDFALVFKVLVWLS